MVKLKDSKSNFNKSPKKKFPGGLLFIFAMILIFLTIQTLNTDKAAKVSFSHQLEHLVNLDLVHKDQNRKIAQNENLVTFSGKFREMETVDAKNRFKFLQLLDKNNDLFLEKQTLTKKLSAFKKEVYDSGEWFLQITGIKSLREGFVIVNNMYDTKNVNNSIVVLHPAKKSIINLADIKKNFETNKEVSSSKSDLLTLVKLFQSPKLGIGAEDLKNKLKALDAKLNSKDLNVADIKHVISVFDEIVGELLKPQNGVVLYPIRSVRTYLEFIDQYNVISLELDKNSIFLEKAFQKVSDNIWYFNNQELSTRALEKQDPEVFKRWYKEAQKEWDNFTLNKGLAFKAPDQERNLVLDKTFKSQQPTHNYFNYIFTFLPVVLVILVLYFLFSRQMKGVGSSAMNFGKSPARLLTKESNKVTFQDVAGAEESKEELSEIVDFLKDPQKFTALGARIPKGVLLVGPPGTGKTLIAKAVAGEADRPFYSISGSDFVEMFVGVGASRVRDLFEQGKKNAPCIIFMDEIDAVGRQRGAGIGGGHDEREQTLNQLLVEMDGFDTKEGVILMAATNRPDVLDKALLRPGRFDRRVVLDLPDVKGRYEILKVHARRIKIDPSVELMDIAKITPGASGADLENILNEAALLAARNGRGAVTSVEARDACDKVRYGKERRSLEMDENEKRSTAFHESGHAFVGLTVKNADPVDKVTIIPRGFALGATHFMPKKNRLGYWKKEVIDQLAIAMGGRAAEETFLNDMSSGAQQDINHATKLARAMVCEWGMSEKLGTITYDEREDSGRYLGLPGAHEKLYSEETAQKIDAEVHEIIQKAYERAKEIISSNKEKIQLMTDMLMEFETLDSVDINNILNGTWNIEEKKERLLQAEKLQVKKPPPPPIETNTNPVEEV